MLDKHLDMLDADSSYVLRITQLKVTLFRLVGSLGVNSCATK